ncbi:MAG TPA: helix-turn-helix transcriptional regulator, partial [Acidobacteriaceae bacterium]
FRTLDSHCRRCRKPLEVEEPEPQQLSLVAAPAHPSAPAKSSLASASIDVAKAVRDLRHARNLSQRQLALRMQVPRTYISKIENGKAVPTLSSLQRLATALEAQLCDLLQDARGRRQDALVSLLADPFFEELLPLVGRLTAYHRSVFLNHVRDMASGRRTVSLA